MLERKTKEITTPSGVTVELQEFITAGEFLDLNEDGEKNGLSKTQLAKRLMETAIVSLSGSTENISARLRDLPISDYTFLAKEMNKLVSGDFTEAKTQASS